MGPKKMNCCKPEQVGTKEYGKMLKTDPGPGGWQGPKKARIWKIEGQKKKNHEERIPEALK